MSSTSVTIRDQDVLHESRPKRCFCIWESKLTTHPSCAPPAAHPQCRQRATEGIRGSGGSWAEDPTGLSANKDK